MRIGIVGIMHESNTFVAEPTTLEDFGRDLLVTGDAVRERLGAAHHEVAGALEALDAAGATAVPLLFARALPGGTIAAEAYDALLGMLDRALEGAGRLDGYLACPHGANVSERHPDMDGHWLGLLRARAGPGVPVVATLDPHANLSPRMVEAVDALVAYRTNPHLDQRERGAEAAALLLGALRGETRPTVRAAFPPVAIGIERQAPSEPPLRALYDLAAEMRREPGVLSISILLGFPYADVPEMGSSVAVVTDGDPARARRLADALAARLLAARRELMSRVVPVEAAVADALAGEGPVCLLDMGDNVGAGTAGDGTALPRAFLALAAGRPGSPRAFVSLHDPEAAARAAAAGPGGRLRLRMGGRSHALYGPPLEAEVVVRGLHDGRFTEREVRHYGMTDWDMGPTAVVETAPDGPRLVVQLTSRRVYPTSLGQLTSCGLDPRAFQVLVAKGVHAPVAAYAPVSRRLVRVDTPGLTCADVRRLTFRHRRRPLHPFEEV
jgi:microcystin degradation protein MlrC